MVEDESGSIVQLVFNGEQVDSGVLAEVGALRVPLCLSSSRLFRRRVVVGESGK
jgi:hypothetical protein